MWILRSNNNSNNNNNTQIPLIVKVPDNIWKANYMQSLGEKEQKM
jgi:hypothetical protein